MKTDKFEYHFETIFPLLCKKGFVSTTDVWKLYTEKDSYALKVFFACMRTMFKEKKVKKLKRGSWEILIPKEPNDKNSFHIRRQMSTNIYRFKSK